MKLLVLLLFLINPLFALYSSQEIIPSNIIGMSPLSSNSGESFALLMDKSNYTLTLFKGNSGEIKPVKKFHAIFGKNQGDKYSQGDSRTPEGIYFIQEIKDDTDLLPKFGKRAFVLNYPNPIDRLNGKTGLGIWLHSVDNPGRLQRLNDTRGCVAISNKDIIELSRIVVVRDTPVIIVDKPQFVSISEQKKNRDQFFEFLKKWKTAWESKDIEKYISFYSKSFYSTAKKMNRARWKSYKNYLNSVYSYINVGLGNINIYNFNSYAAIIFQQTYASPGLSDTGKKLIYLEEEDGKYKIVSESWFALRNLRRAKVTEGNKF